MYFQYLGIDGQYRPDKRGFDTALTDITDSQQNHFNPTLQRNGVAEKHEGYRTDIFFNEAMKFIESNKDNNFFCYIPTYSPHSPLVVPEAYSKMYEDNPRKNFLGMVTNVDENVGRLRKKIASLGLKDDTVLILMNDNGATWGLDVHDAGIRGRKGSALYGGIKALSFWSWPKKWRPRDVGQLTGHVDLLPTIADLINIKIDKELKPKLDGVSLMSLLDPDASSDSNSKKVLKENERMLVAHRSRWSKIPNLTEQEHIEQHKYSYCSVRWKNYILVRVDPCKHKECSTCQKVHKRCLPTYKGQRPYSNNIDHYEAPDRKWKLYDLSNDLYQRKDLSASKPEVVKKMSDYYEQWWKEVWRR